MCSLSPLALKSRRGCTVLYSTAGFPTLPLHTEQTIFDSNEEYAITVACRCSTGKSTLHSLLSRYTCWYSNNFSFLREAEPSKLLNCSHHLSIKYWSSREQFLKVSIKTNQLKRASLWIAQAFGRRFPDNHFMDGLCSTLYMHGKYCSLMLNCFRERYWHVDPRKGSCSVHDCVSP